MLDELFFAHSWFGILNLSFITYFFWRCIYCMCHLSTLWAIRDVSSWQLKWQNGYVRRHETIPSGSPFRPLWVWCVPFDCHSLDVKRKYLPSTFRLWFFFVRFPFSAAALFCFHEHFLIDLPLFGCRFCCRCRLHRGHDQLAAKTTASSLSPTVISSNFLSFIYYYYYFFFFRFGTHTHTALRLWVCECEEWAKKRPSILLFLACKSFCQPSGQMTWSRWCLHPSDIQLGKQMPPDFLAFQLHSVPAMQSDALAHGFCAGYYLLGFHLHRQEICVSLWQTFDQ